MEVLLTTNRLTKTYGKARGIEGLDLAVAKGEIFGFLGPNGAGKTTTIRTLLDLLHPTSGSATIFGLDSQRDSRQIRGRVGNLPGEFAFESHTTGDQLLRLFARLRGMADLGDADALAERFRADLSRPLRDLSRGNRQKVGLIQALFHRPDLLILDEPTTGLDPLMQEEFMRVVVEQQQRGATVFLSSHDLDEVERVCDRVGIIRDGQLVAVEEVAAMRSRAWRTVVVRFAGPVNAGEFNHLPGVRDAQAEGNTLSFRALDGFDQTIKALARHEVVDVEITRPTLEELFLSYYSNSEQP